MPPARPPSDGSLDLTRRYLGELGSHPLLTAAQEAELAEAIALGREAEARLTAATAAAASPDGDKSARLTARERARLTAARRAGDDARRQFIQSNLRLVVSIAKRYQSPGMSLLDPSRRATSG